MSRRQVQFFNLSFLDVLSGALGAVIFMFIITPKGGNPAAPSQQMSVSFDTVHRQVWGMMHDSLLTKSPGDTLFAIVVDYKKLPTIESCPPCPKCIKCPELKNHNIANRRSETSVQSQNNPIASNKTENTSTTSNSNAPAQPIQHKYKGDPPSVPCRVSFELKWNDLEDNVDFFVCKGSTCVYGARKKDAGIGNWDSGKSKNRIFGDDLRTTMEAVRQFDKVIPGEYKLYAQFKQSLKPKESITVTGLIYSKTEQDEVGENFTYTLPIQSKGRTLIGKVNLEENGKFTFIKN